LIFIYTSASFRACDVGDVTHCGLGVRQLGWPMPFVAGRLGVWSGATAERRTRSLTDAKDIGGKAIAAAGAGRDAGDSKG